MTKYLIQLKNISKSFGKVDALKKVDFNIGFNEIVGMVGDNGAGKSTLIKIMAGFLTQDEGEIYFKGERMKKYSIKKARELGIEIVYQERALAEQQTLWRNVFMGRELTNRFGFLQMERQKEETDRIMKEIGFTSLGVSPDSVIKTLSGGEKQGVAITRALYFKANLIILDEPTMGLSLAEVEKTLDFVREIKRERKSCIFITHNIYHVYPVADKFVVLDRGELLGEFKKKDIPLKTLSNKLLHIAKTGGIE